MDLYSTTLGERLKKLRESKGLLQKELCDLIDISEKMYSKYETDRIVNPTPEIIKKIADFYEVPIDVLMRKDSPFNHLPHPILEMIRQKDSVSFLVRAYKEYQQYLEEKNSL